MVEVGRGRDSKIQLVVDVGDRRKHRRAAAKDMRSGVVGVQTEPTAKIGTMSTRISEHHVVGESNDVKASIGREPGRCPSMIAEKMSRIRRLQAHDRTLFVNVLTIGSNT